MRFTRLIMLIAAIATVVGFLALAEFANAQSAKATIDDPVGPPPDPTHIPTVLPKDIKWTGQEGRQQQGLLFGDPTKPGIYGVVIKWYPGNFSQPAHLAFSAWQLEGILVSAVAIGLPAALAT